MAPKSNMKKNVNNKFDKRLIQPA